MITRGKFIVIYGPNNLGKTTQAKRLVEGLKTQGIQTSYLKYPVYDLEPTGPRLNGILRLHSEITTPRQLQEIFVQNRRDYEPTLKTLLESGAWIVAEDYKGTGIAWGVVYGVPLRVMEEMNADLLDEDLAICLDGKRFLSGVELEHLHESGNRWELSCDVHKKLARRYEWEIVNANQPEDTVETDIRGIVERELLIPT